ncbi:MAG: DUF4876 domain-containing protein [Bacteroidetes bacterium]|nr:DUF4876 domain-containing protein [Bacteroidota bacterium]
MKKNYYTIVFLALLLISACKEEGPVNIDGQAEWKIYTIWDRSAYDSNDPFKPLSNAKIVFNYDYGEFSKLTDENGVLKLYNLPSGIYTISVVGSHPEDDNIFLVGNKKEIRIWSGGSYIDTIFTMAVSSSGIAINEVYFAGPVNRIFYFFDQFVELYNSSNEIKYLDGMVLMRVSGNQDDGERGPGADENSDGDIDGITYAYQFPGKPGGKEYPFLPKTFLVIASDAVDHRKYVSTSIDLTIADWECYNQYASNESDNVNVPNLLNLFPEKTTDFYISLGSDIVVLATGEDTDLEDGLDIDTIIDGLEYDMNVTSLKTLDDRVDRGRAKAPAKYSGQSIQRKVPGVDTNDGTLDWEILNGTTPGYHK